VEVNRGWGPRHIYTRGDIERQKMGSKSLSSKFIWLICLVLVLLLLVDQILQFADANKAESSVEQAIRQALNRRKAEQISSKRVLDGTEKRLGEERLGGEAREEEYIKEDEIDEDVESSRRANQKASVICAFGAAFSLYTLLVEHMKWDPKSFQRFSVATKIPVEIFCISGPLVLVSAIIYTMLAGLLLTGSSSSSAFFIASSWSAIMIDMSFVCYSNAVYEIFSNRIDLVLHLVNAVTVVYTFNQLRFFPFTFVICGLSFWAVVIAIRVFRRLSANDRTPPSAIFRPGSP
jgi:hypothetical protein